MNFVPLSHPVVTLRKQMLLFQQQQSTGGCSHNKWYNSRKEYICTTSVYFTSWIQNWAPSKDNQLYWIIDVQPVTLYQPISSWGLQIGTISGFDKLSILIMEQEFYSKWDTENRANNWKKKLKNIFIITIEAWFENQ